ncbi:MAG TPA: CDP-alcohol phosphatidyltransferase family protein [Clostridia bacterium]|nr:CDP-alcohol phosphatidyltransferase family protein [Clostridia bacterium]HPQ46002.1 CDP-alcohol phosphatidyltransferase family protein [Clostridia bacterium]
MKKHIPNMITAFRLVLIPVFIFLVLNDYTVAAAFVFLGASLSDLLDGYLARKWKAVSNFGKLFDPLADKAIQISAILLLCVIGRLHFAFIIILGIKEALMIYGSYLLYKKKVVVFAVWYGKAAAFLLNAAVFWSYVLSIPNYLTNAFMAVAMAAELFALTLYTIRYFKLKKSAATESASEQ